MNEKYHIDIDKDIIASLPYALLVVDSNLKVIRHNQSCEFLLSKPVEEILGLNLSEIIPHRELEKQVRSVLQKGGVRLIELYLSTKTPTILKATITALSELDYKGSNFCMIALEDIRERVQLEEQLLQSEKLAGMGLLAASIAHELGNPLSVMASTLQYIRGALLNTTNQSLIEMVDVIMNDGIEQMHGLLQSLSGFASSQRPKFELADLRRTLLQILTFINKQAEASKIKTSYLFDENLPNCQLNTRDLRQMFLNLFKNAIEAMPNGGELHIKAYLLKDQDAICIDISDTGCGISKADLRSIFRPFYSTKPNGTGLGLPFCRHVAEEHGGEITVKSQMGKGSTFSVTLPIRQEGRDKP